MTGVSLNGNVITVDLLASIDFSNSLAGSFTDVDPIMSMLSNSVVSSRETCVLFVAF